MPLNHFTCKECEAVLKTFKKSPECCGRPMEKKLGVPSVKYLEYRDQTAKEKKRPILKDQDRMLRERSRDHARDVELHDLIQSNEKKVVEENQWINKDGSKRRRIDDI